MIPHRSLLVACVLAGLATAVPVAQPAAPVPESVIGFPPCADYKLATYEQIADYFKRLDGVSDRMQLVDIGKTAEGRTQLMAIISSERNMARLARFKEIAQRLALARGLTDDEARALAGEGRAIVWIDFGLHSTEVAHGQTAPLMAYHAVTDESDEMRFIRDNVVFLLVPNMNPDGTTLVANWYMKNVGTPYEKSSPPELYQKYVGHDNNRDWYMFNMPESQNVARQLYEEWFPQIVYDQHQSAPFPARIFVPPFEDPMNPNIPPLVMRGVNLVGDAITRRLDQEGKAGAISRISYDTWWNGGMRTAPYYHNMIGILTETGHASATPATYDPKSFPKTFANGVPVLEPTTYYPNPYQGGDWRLRDSCDYMLSASLAVLDIGAKRREEWLYDIYRMGRDAIAAGRSETYVVPADQPDPGSAVRLINALRRGGIAVSRARQAFTVEGRAYPAGSFVIPASQAFRAHVVDLLNPQVYPDQRLYPGGPPERPYDITGWTLPFQMGVRVDRVGAVTTELDPLEGLAPLPPGTPVERRAVAYAIHPAANDAFTAVNRLLARGVTVGRTIEPLSIAGDTWPAGAFLVQDSDEAFGLLEELAGALPLRIAALDAVPPSGVRPLVKPRLALYRRHGGDMDEGWTRWVLEQFEFPYSTLTDTEVRAGHLHARYDVIVLPDNSYETMLTGLASGTMPPEYVGGMTPSGVANLYQFVSAGGTLVTLDTAAELPLTAFGLPIRNVTAHEPESEFYVPGSILEIAVDTTHPVAFGMPAEAAAFFAHSPAFTVGRPTRAQDGTPDPSTEGIRIVARYPEGEFLMSGWMLGERLLAGRAAVVEADVGNGRVVLLGFRAQHRGQAHGTFKLLFNSIYLGSLGPPAAGIPSGDASGREP